MTGARDGDALRPDMPMDDVDFQVLALVRRLHEATDPVPAEAYARVRFALDLVGADRELVALCELATPVTMARGTEQAVANTLSFESPDLVICLTITRSGTTARLDGWLDPPAGLRVELITGTMSLHSTCDVGGRFAFEGITAGEVRIAVHPGPGSAVGPTRTIITAPFVL